MKTAVSLPLYREINECHQASGFPVRTDLPEFHVFTFDETYPATRQAMPPFRRGFHQITYFEALGTATVRHESETFTGEESALLFSAPEHVLSWICGGHERGMMIYFKDELLTDPAHPLEREFPFFGLTAMNMLSLAPADRASFLPQFAQMHGVFHSGHPYRREKLAALLRAFLYDCRAAFEAREQRVAQSPAGSALVTRFLEMVARCFQERCAVEQYAECLHVSTDHLSAVVKERTGRNARDIIAERVVLEAKRLLTHTDLSVSEIADHLQFSEPTHFARFFKRYTQRSPLEFRREIHRASAAAPMLVAVNA